jgi:SAM-dependent methyltransferase
VRVVDLGAGTGNASRIVLEGRDRPSVWAVEKNMAMLDSFRAKEWVRAAGDRLKIVKSSVEHLEMLASEEPFDAAVAVNTLYAVDDVPACLGSLNQVLRLGGTFSFSTTDKNTKLGPLLDDIAAELSRRADWKELLPHYNRVQSLNMKLEEKGVTTRYTRDQYIAWLEQAGFRVDLYEPGHYTGAVVVGRATKVAELVPPAEESAPALAVVRPAAPVLSATTT